MALEPGGGLFYTLRRPLKRARREFEGETATRIEEGPKLGTYVAVVDARKRIPRRRQAN